ncbi:hypothetical protein FGO68_gene16526 [Halteria grandinella]|uniref:Uncharacterized protein n=1 Tax=Halteria grandinella TaxID=5974 RepID=A0A8J8NLS1_HALGN|nr:hypothetical protein FGO68_gene16526 [Halteria grandinella]
MDFDILTFWIPAISFAASFLFFPALFFLRVLPLSSMIGYMITLGLQISSPLTSSDFFEPILTASPTILAQVINAWAIPWQIKLVLGEVLSGYIDPTIFDVLFYGAFGVTVLFEIMAIFLPVFKDQFFLWLLIGPFYLINTILKTYVWKQGVLIFQEKIQAGYELDPLAEYNLSNLNFKFIQLLSYILIVAPSNVAIMNFISYV